MELKEKPCKGIGKANGVTGCGTKTKFRNHGLCMKCYPDFILNTDAGKMIMQKSIIKVTAPRLIMEKAEREHKENTKLKAAHQNTKIQVHSFVRDRDKGLPCISCDAPHNDSFQAGHFYKSETFTTLKYHLDNIHGQCVRCNIFLSGNFDNYALRLAKRIGEEKYRQLAELAEIDKQTAKTWDIDRLKEIRNNLKKKSP